MTWRKMSEHVFPWRIKNVVLAVYDQDDPARLDVLRAHVGEHGAFFTNDGSWLTVLEQGWVPYAWKEDNTPNRDDVEWPPLKTDYLITVE